METGNKVVVRSLIYKFLESVAAKGAGLIIGIILARLLAPEEFGQVAIIMVFINLATTIIQSGFGTALVQTKEIDDRDYSTVFYITLALSGLMVAILYVSAPFIASFYSLPKLVWPIRVYSFSLFFGSFNSIQIAKMQREMRFKPMMYTSLSATIFSGVIGVSLAYMGTGIWALVFYGCSNIFFSCFAMLVVERWLPKLVFSWESAKKLFSYGWKILVSGMLCTIYKDIRSLIIGKKFSTEDLAYYDRGQQFPVIISTTLDSAIQSVMLPVLSRSQDDRKKLIETLKRTISLGVLIVTPIMVGLAVVAEPVILLLYTEKWLAAVPYMRLLCAAEIVIPIMSSNLIAIKAMGKSGTYMKLEIVRRIVMVVILFTAVFAFDSVFAIAVSATIIAWVDIVIIMLTMKRIIGYGPLQQFKDIWRTLASSAIMGVVVYLVGMISMPTIILLLVQVFAGIITYIGASWILNRSMFYDIIGMARGALKKNS